MSNKTELVKQSHCGVYHDYIFKVDSSVSLFDNKVEMFKLFWEEAKRRFNNHDIRDGVENWLSEKFFSYPHGENCRKVRFQHSDDGYCKFMTEDEL